jgi:hypothetical protein
VGAPSSVIIIIIVKGVVVFVSFVDIVAECIYGIAFGPVH